MFQQCCNQFPSDKVGSSTVSLCEGVFSGLLVLFFILPFLSMQLFVFSPSSLFFILSLFFFKGHSTIFICLKIWQTDSSRGDGGDYVCGVIRRQFVKPTLLGMGLLRQTIRTVFFQLCCSLENDPFEFHLWLLKDNKINVIEVFPVPKHLASK